MEYREKVGGSIVSEVLAIGRSGDYELLVVGRGRFPSTFVAELADRQAEHAELGLVGDILASTNKGVVCSVLVIQQHDLADAKETPMTKVARDDDLKKLDGEGSSSSPDVPNGLV